jgi:alanine dehydrogenase
MKHTLLLSRSDVEGLITLEESIPAIEQVFRDHHFGLIELCPLIHADVAKGEFHIKAGGYREGSLPYFTTKINGGFFANPALHNMPSILGLIVLNHIENGFPLAVMESSLITALRTSAAMGVAAKYLANPQSSIATICGCGKQAYWLLKALLAAMPHIDTVFVFSRNFDNSLLFSNKMSKLLEKKIVPTIDLEKALKSSQICITCTPSQKYIIEKPMLPPNIFIAAMGADSPDKQELDPSIFEKATIVADSKQQCAAAGDLHHALNLGYTDLNQVIELGEIIANKSSQRKHPEGIVIFDSTGTAMQDTAIASIAYEKGIKNMIGMPYHFFSI